MTENYMWRWPEEFYSSDAVLHPVPRSYFEKTADEALRSDAYAEIYLLEHEGKPARYGLTARTFSQEAGRPGFVDRRTLYQNVNSDQKVWAESSFPGWKKRTEAGLRGSDLRWKRRNCRAISLYERLGYKVLDYVQMIKDFQ